jgi:hypothetical protein
MFQIKFVERIETHFKFNIIFENRAFCEIMYKNMIEPDGPQMHIQNAHFMLDTLGYRHTQNL